MFVVLYNSCPLWTAGLSWLFLNKRLGGVQVLGVVLVCAGLVCNVWGSTTNHATEETEEGWENEGGGVSVVMGSVLVLVGSLLHSLMFVLSDAALSSSSHSEHGPIKISAQVWSSCLGILEASVMTLWVICHTLQGGFHDDPHEVIIDQSGGSTSDAIKGFALLLLIDALHAAAFFQLLQTMGALPSALLKGVQTVAVVVLSVIFYCPSTGGKTLTGDAVETTACLTPLRAISVVLVVGGMLVYATFSRRRGGEGQDTEEEEKKCGAGRVSDGEELWDGSGGISETSCGDIELPCSDQRHGSSHGDADSLRDDCELRPLVQHKIE